MYSVNFDEISVTCNYLKVLVIFVAGNCNLVMNASSVFNYQQAENPFAKLTCIKVGSSPIRHVHVDICWNVL